MQRKLHLLTTWLVILIVFLAGPAPATASPATSAVVQAPVMKWQKGGCYASWCETGWYSSPAVADLDADGVAEVIGSAYTIFVLDGRTGALKWKMPSGYDRSQPNAGSVGRTWPDIVLADVDADGHTEIVTAHAGGYISVYTSLGYFKPGWPQHPVDYEFRALAVGDMEGNATLEIAVGQAMSDAVDVWLYGANGSLKPNWPPHTGPGYSAGIYNTNLAIGRLGSNTIASLVAPSDVHYVCAYGVSGSQVAANAMYGTSMPTWCAVPAYVSPADELQGWGACSDTATYRANFSESPANLVDVNGDGLNEVVVVGNVHNCNTNPYTDVYLTPYIFNADRSRFHTGSYDWTTPPLNTGTPLSEDFQTIETAEANPVTVDLDGDGKLEILYASYDGRLHAFWLDKTEHGSWPFQVKKPAESFIRFASEPAVADLDGDGHAEVVVASWTQKGSNRTGKLHILDYQGNELQAVDLPAAVGEDWNGALPAPTLADIDGDPDLEVVLNTANSGFVAYDLPGTANARVLWGTGRGNYQRTGSILRGTLEGSSKTVSPILPDPGDALTYTLVLRNPGPQLPGVRVTDTLPAELHLLGNLDASSGSLSAAGNTIRWTGAVPAAMPVTITFGVNVDAHIATPRLISNIALIDDGLGNLWQRRATVIAGGYPVYLPVIQRSR